MRVLMVAPTSFFMHYGGHIRILAETRALQALGHEITIVTYYKGEDLPGLDIRRTARLPWRADYEVGSSRHKIAFDAYLAAKVWQVGRQTRPDIIHGHMHEGALIGGLLARWWRRPLVFDFQGSLTGEMIDHGFIRPAGVGYQLWRRIEWLAARLPQAVLVSSLRAAPLLQEQFGVPPARIHPLPDCADLAHFDPARFSAADKAAVRAQFGIPAGRPVVAYLGLLADYQGTPHLLHAAAQLKAAGEDVHFLVMGFPNEDQYLAMAVALGVEDRVTFTGRVDYEKHAPLYLSVGDIAVSPKLSATEGSGKVLNYMALGQPVVAFDTRVHREYLADLGVYVPRGDVAGLAEAIRALLHDPGRGWALGQQLRQRAIQLYSWTAAAQKIEAVYASLLAARGARPLAGNLREDLE